jgi:cytochrome c oxidase cbb3-type subunit 1
MSRAVNADGTLTYAWIEIVKFTYPYYLVRLAGGVLCLAGMVIMAVNVVRTMRLARHPAGVAVPPAPADNALPAAAPVAGATA